MSTQGPPLGGGRHLVVSSLAALLRPGNATLWRLRQHKVGLTVLVSHDGRLNVGSSKA